jgi:pyrroline-5-carboxylate reductase
MTYGVLGVGALAGAIVTGLCEGVEDAPQVLLSPRNAELSAALATRFPTVSVAPDNQAVVDGAPVILACVRPQIADVLGELRFSPEHVVISAMAGVPVEAIAELVAPATDIARVIPLPSVARREGITPVHPPHAAAKALFDRLGQAVEVPELAAYDAFAVATATIAAHFAYLDTIATWLVEQGVPAPVATDYLAAIFAGLGPATLSGASFEALAREHATAGGINEQFCGDLERGGVYDLVQAALQRVLDRLRGH